MKMKVNFKKITKILCIMVVLLIIFMPLSHVFGQINPNNSESGGIDFVKGAIGKILSISTGPLTTAISLLLNSVIAIVFILLYFVFSPISAGLTFPFPDQIIFNKLAFFDPNFINPPSIGGTLVEKSPVVILHDLISNLYYTGFVIAGTVFLIAALIIGIKLAISTIASEKAHYKQALMNWLTGLFLLFTTHFIMLIIFTVNEQLVNIISTAADTVTFKVDFAMLIPYAGKTISSLVNGLGSFFLDSDQITFTEVNGYGGLILRYAVYAFGGDLTSSIICGILLGQTCALLIMYTKRLFYSIILGIVAPLIVAADIMKKTF
jgi:hypothetical protein